MIHHLISDSPYTEPFIQLLEAHPGEFPPTEHCFWIERAPGSAFRAGGTGPIRRIEVGPWGFLRAFRALSRGDRVVIHQLNNPRLLLYLFCFRRDARRCAWQIWGGDVYYFRYRPRTWPHALREALRRAVIPALPVISGILPGDFETVRSVYGSRAKYVRAFYPIPMDDRSLQATTGSERPRNGATLLVGNSGDPANDHAGVFRSLARFRSQGVRIVSPLSYGDAPYVASVIALGRELYGDQFTPLTEFLPPEQYARLIGEVDAAIMNHGYQQALGNIVALLMLGKKVFVRSDTTPYGYFHDLGIAVFDTLRLPDLSLTELVEFSPETGRRNADSVRALLSEPNAVAGWKALFETVRGLS
jgi:hypothetical protein